MLSPPGEWLTFAISFVHERPQNFHHRRHGLSGTAIDNASPGERSRGHRAGASRVGTEAAVELPVFFGNALDKNTFADGIKPADTFVQLVGAAHPSPAKA